MIKKGMLIVFLIGVTAAYAKNSEQINRYGWEKSRPPASHLALFKSTVKGLDLRRSETVYDALQSILPLIGYKLADFEVSDPQTPYLLDSKLPISLTAKRLEKTSLISIIQAAIGHEWTIVIDPVHRLISFELQPDVAEHYRY